MRENSVVAANLGRGARLAALFLGLMPLTGFLAGCGGGGAGDKSDSTSGDMLVVAVTPTNGQETLANLSDPELNGRLTMTLSGIPTSATIIDPQNAVNLLTPNVQILDQSFARVRGTPAVDPATRTFTFTPAGGSLPPAQYTVTMSKFVSSTAGKLLNNGLEDFSSSWTVGPDVYPPVVRNVSPANNQSDVPLFTPIVVTFNESLDAASVVLGQTVFVQDGGTNPPTQLGGTLALKRNGFDIVFTPDPCVGLPPATTVVFRMLGANNVSFIRDLVGNPLVGDIVTNEVQFQFNTKGVKPLPIALNMHDPGSPRFFGSPNPFLAYVATRDRVYAFDTSAAMYQYQVNFTTEVALVQQVLETNRRPTLATPPTSWFYGPLYGGDYEAKLGQCGEAIIDWRWDGNGTTYIYMIDQADESVAILNSATGRVEGHFKGLGTPRGIGMTSPGSAGNTPVLLVSNFGQATVTAIDIGPITPGQPICTAVKELEDDKSRRVFMPTGRNPSGVAAYWGTQGIPAAGVVSQADGEFQVFDPRSLAPLNGSFLGVLSESYGVGENPIDCGWSPYFPLQGWIFAFIANQGGVQNPTGSVSLWWNATTGFNPFNSRSGTIATTVTEGINIPGLITVNNTNYGNWFHVPNTGSDDIAGLDVSFVGGYIYTTPTVSVVTSRPVGDNPTSMSFAGYLGVDIAFVPLPGLGVVGAYTLESTVVPPVYFSLPGARYTVAWQGQ